jgi:hypothetical protein
MKKILLSIILFILMLVFLIFLRNLDPNGVKLGRILGNEELVLLEYQNPNSSWDSISLAKIKKRAEEVAVSRFCDLTCAPITLQKIWGADTLAARLYKVCKVEKEVQRFLAVVPNDTREILKAIALKNNDSVWLRKFK